MKINNLHIVFLLLILTSCKSAFHEGEQYGTSECKGFKTVKKIAKNKSIKTIYHFIDFCNIKEYVWYYDEKSIVYYKITSEDKIKTKKRHVAKHWVSTVGFEYGSFFEYGIDNFECFIETSNGGFKVFQKDESNKFKSVFFIFDLECLKNTRYDENSFGRFIQYDLSVILEDDFYGKLYSNAITE